METLQTQTHTLRFSGIRNDGFQNIDSMPGLESAQCAGPNVSVCYFDGWTASSIEALFRIGDVINVGSRWGCKEAEIGAFFLFQISEVGQASNRCLHLRGSSIRPWEYMEELNVTIVSRDSPSESKAESANRRDFSPIDGPVVNQHFNVFSSVANLILFNDSFKIFGNLSAAVVVHWEISAVTKQCPRSYLYCPPSTHCCGWFTWCCHTSWYGHCKGHCTGCSANCADDCYWTTTSPGDPCGTYITHNKVWIEMAQRISVDVNISAALPMNTSWVGSVRTDLHPAWSWPMNFAGIKGTFNFWQKSDIDLYINSSAPISMALDIVMSNSVFGLDYTNGAFTLISQAAQPTYELTRPISTPTGPSAASVSILFHPSYELAFQNGSFSWDQAYPQGVWMQVGYDILLALSASVRSPSSPFAPVLPMASTQRPQMCSVNHLYETTLTTNSALSQQAAKMEGGLLAGSASLSPQAVPGPLQPSTAVDLQCGAALCPAAPSYFCKPGLSDGLAWPDFSYDRRRWCSRPRSDSDQPGWDVRVTVNRPV